MTGCGGHRNTYSGKGNSRCELAQPQNDLTETGLLMEGLSYPVLLKSFISHYETLRGIQVVVFLVIALNRFRRLSS